MVNGIRKASRRFGLTVVAFACLAGPTTGLMAQEQASQAKPADAAQAAAEKEAKLRHGMQQVFDKYPEKFSAEVRQGFADRQVVVGMDPYLAHLSAGAFTYQVEADPSAWPRGADPMRVMWAQAMRPDNSKIRMTFENATQYPGQGVTRFSVDVENGRVKEIRKI